MGDNTTVDQSTPTMKISYVTTDLIFESTTNLSSIVEELGKNIIVHHDDWLADAYRVALGIADTDSTAHDAVTLYCSVLEKLSEPSKTLWDGCTRRILDIAFESGTEPESATYQLADTLVRRVAALGIGIALTLYRVGAYSRAGE